MSVNRNARVGYLKNLLPKLFSPKKPVTVVVAVLMVGTAAFLVLWLNLSWRPDIAGLPPDSGFYAYIGKAILHGQIPYRDLWDNKPPLGYYLNALALFVFGQTTWGVWWSSVVWILGCIVLLFGVIKKLFGVIAAGIASILLLVALMNPQIFQGGNLMEVYAIAPQIGIIGITYLFFTNGRKLWLAVLVGVLTAGAFLIKQPTIMLGCSSLLLMIISSISEWKVREAFRTAVGFLLGFLGLVALVSVYWLWIGAFSSFLDGAFLQGFSSIGGSQSSFRSFFIHALATALPNLYIGRLYLIAMLACGLFLVEKLYQFWIKPVLKERLSWIEWCLLVVLILFPLAVMRLWPNSYIVKYWVISIISLGFYFLVKYYRVRSKPVYQQVFSPVEWTWLVAVVALPLEVLMASLGGRYYGHYFITILPAVMLAIAYPIWRAVSVSRASFKFIDSMLVNAMYMILMICTLVWGARSFIRDMPAAMYTSDLAEIFSGQYPLNELEQYIVQSTQPDDEVLVWHIHLGINFVTDRKAPSRFLYPLNLFIPANEQNTKLKEYVNDLESHPPELIVVQKASSLGLPFVDTPIDQLCSTSCTPDFKQAIDVPQIRQEWLRFQQFFDTHYALDTEIYDWNVYRKLP
jgi:4-amino-4-deoxy-L-arabinose transferase-like glycosyltransferase